MLVIDMTGEGHVVAEAAREEQEAGADAYEAGLRARQEAFVGLGLQLVIPSRPVETVRRELEEESGFPW